MSRGAAIPEAIAAAARWRLAALLLERPRAGWLAEIERLAAEVDDAPLRAAASCARAAREGDYLALLGPGGAVSPREVAYRGREDPGWVMADVGRYYDAFAYHPRAEDPADHVAVEAGFVGYLWLKEAAALAADDVAAAGMTAEVRDAFVRDHVAPMAWALADAVIAAGDDGTVAVAAAALAGMVPAPAARATPA